MKIAITGHRKIDETYSRTSPKMSAIKAKIIDVIQKEAKDFNSATFVTGMALGVDQLFAEIAIKSLRPFIAVIPCINQHIRWPVESQKYYLSLLNSKYCTKHYVSNELYTPDCMQKRNEWIVDNCDLLIAIFNGTPGGTANCIKYAESKNKKLIIINPDGL